MLDNVLYYSGIALWIAIILWLILRVIFGKNWMLKVGSTLFLGPSLMQSAKKLRKEIKEREIKDDTLTEVAVKIFWRLTRISFIGLLIAGLPTWLLMQQNSLINIQNELFNFQNERIDKQTTLIETQTSLLRNQNEKFDKQNLLFEDQNKRVTIQTELLAKQNELITNQNARIDTQNYRLYLQNNLIEADRRSSLIFLMNDILDKIASEVEYQHGISTLPEDKVEIKLDDLLIGRIVALSRSLIPYQRLVDDKLTPTPRSPERSQLLLSLLQIDFADSTMAKINRFGQFQGVLLMDLKIEDKYLSEIKMPLSNLSNSILKGVNLHKANLSNSDLMWITCDSLNMQNVNLGGVVATLGSFRFADLKSALLSGGKFNEADFQGANLQNATLTGGSFKEANFQGADMRKALLWNADLKGANLTNVKFDHHFNLGPIKQLELAKSLKDCIGLPTQLKDSLMQIKPELFQ